MLSESERRELRMLAQSSSIREEFRRLRVSSRARDTRPVDLDRLLDFLTTMSRLSTRPSRPRRFVPYAQVRI